MKLYAITYTDDEQEKTYTQYVGTQADSSKLRTTLKKDGMTNIKAEDAEVPTDKAGLIAYLNKLTGPA